MIAKSKLNLNCKTGQVHSIKFDKSCELKIAFSKFSDIVEDEIFNDINKIRFFYQGQDKTEKFKTHDPVSSLDIHSSYPLLVLLLE